MHDDLSPALEAMLMLATEPVTVTELATALAAPEAEVAAALAALAAWYDETGRGFALRELAGGWRYYTREEYDEVINRWLLEGQVGRLTGAALETLSVVAYLQPISRGRVSAIRGVNVEGVLRTLSARGLVAVVHQDPETGAHLYGTTELFLEKMGLKSLEELPPIAPYLPDASLLEAELAELVAQAPAEAPADPQLPTEAETADE
ncbi:MAG: SMC-Scp complex subunit ScpB [Propionibacteriaceae bacterium]|jgi:segregation and condensation protein B|nr:SMC-Scp complex subunit ScpB [Propionibacteriaceae bacterium]